MYKHINMIRPVIVAIAKLEGDYIEEWVKYHIGLGFAHIYLYDNEDIPIYKNQLHKYENENKITVIHAPYNNHSTGPIQYIILHHFMQAYIPNQHITHVAHIDIDEFIVLKRHTNISEFITEYINGDCAGIGINWRHFGCNGQTTKSISPVTERFTTCESLGNRHIKTIFDARLFVGFNTCHAIIPKPGYRIKNTNGDIINGPYNDNITFDTIQLNHYKTKTLPELRYARTRGRADMNVQTEENIEEIFAEYDKNEIQDTTARDFYRRLTVDLNLGL